MTSGASTCCEPYPVRVSKRIKLSATPLNASILKASAEISSGFANCLAREKRKARATRVVQVFVANVNVTETKRA